MTKKNLLFFTRVIGVLLVITMCVAALLALVNEVTKDKIAENERNEINTAVGKLFPKLTDMKHSELEVSIDESDFNSLSKVLDGDTPVGYYAKVSPKGFKGAVVLLVGISLDGKVCGIEIVSSGETPGIGDKIEQSSFLDKFKGQDKATLNVDTISGSTYSSRAVINGTKTALMAYEAYLKGLNQNDGEVS